MRASRTLAQLRRRRLERQLVAQRLDLAEIEIRGNPSRQQAGAPCHFGRHVRVAVAIAADPGAEPHGVTPIGRPRPVLARKARSTLRKYRGNASHRLCSNTMRPLRTSSRGVGGRSRISSVAHAASISRWIAAISSCCSGGGDRDDRGAPALARSGCISERACAGRLRSDAPSAPARSAGRTPPHAADRRTARTPAAARIPLRTSPPAVAPAGRADTRRRRMR